MDLLRKYPINNGKGFYTDASEESKELTKKLYYAMKRAKVFYLFQKSFRPSRGLPSDGMAEIDRKVYTWLDRFNIGDVCYIPVTDMYKQVHMHSMPNFIKEWAIIERMLNHRLSYEFSSEREYKEWVKKRMSREDAAKNYAKYYFSDFKLPYRFMPKALTMRFIFGILFTILFIVMFFYALAAMSPKISFVLLGMLMGFTAGLSTLAAFNRD